MKNKKKWLKGFIITLSVISILSMIYIFYQYQKTQTWFQKDTSVKLANQLPYFATNVVDINDYNDAKILTQLDQKVTLETDPKKLESDIERIKVLLDKFQLTDTRLEQLELDLKTIKFIKNPYDPLDVDTLNTVLINKNEAFKEPLMSIADMYKQIAIVYNNVLEYGELVGDTLITSPQIVNLDKILDDLITVNKIPIMQPIRDDFNKYSTDILINARIQRELDDWQEQKKRFLLMKKSDYLTVDNVQTLADAKHLGLSIQGNDERKGYKIDERSNVIRLTYNGTSILNNQYFKPVVTAVIDPIYVVDESFETSTTTTSRLTLPRSDEQPETNTSTTQRQTEQSTRMTTTTTKESRPN